MATIALKIDVDTLRGTQEGVPRLLRLLDAANVRATFLFSMGPDHTGRALRRVLRPGFLSKVARTSVVAHYGWRTLLYGLLLPGPDIGRTAADVMRSVRRAGHECGLHAWDHVLWQDKVRYRDAAWTVRQMTLAFDRFGEVFGGPPATHGAAGWQMNSEAFRQLDRWKLTHASDVRGSAPFVPVIDGRPLAHVQLPTTLPTLDEVLCRRDPLGRDAARQTLALTTEDRPHVHTAHAELEGGAFAGVLADLVDGWKSQGHRPGTLQDSLRAIDPSSLARIPVAWGTVPGRSGELAAAFASQRRTSPSEA